MKIAHHFNDSLQFKPLFTKINLLAKWNSLLSTVLYDEKNLLMHCFIIDYKSPTLMVIVDNANWLMRFRLHIPKIIDTFKKTNEFKALEFIDSKIKISQYPFTKPTMAQKNTMKISTANAKILQDTALTLKDPKLKKILERFAAYAKD